MQQLVNFSEINQLITIYEQLKKEINDLNALSPSLQNIARIKALILDLDIKIQQLKTMLITTALMYTSNIQNR